MDYRDFCEIYEINLNPQQERAVLKTEGPALMISVPGSGKTTVITARAGYMIYCKNIPPSEILTVTFSVEAARSMEVRFIKKFGDSKGRPVFRTIHSLSLDIIKTYCKKYRKKPHKILENSEAVLRKIIENKTKSSCRDDVLKDLSSGISKAKNLMYDASEISEIKVKKADFPEVMAGYEAYKRKKKLMDFDDIMIFALQILEECPDILDIYQSRFQYFNVDEAQDNSLVQNRIMEKLSSKTTNLFMVGDEDQCIYGFRGAYPQAFFEFSEKWGEENIIKLETNYRSLGSILRKAEAFISRNKNRYEKRLIGARQGEGSVKVKDFRTASERNRYIAEDCKKYKTAAVLARNNSSLVSLVFYLEEAGVDYSLKEGKNDFFEGTPIMDIISIIHASKAYKGEAEASRNNYVSRGSDESGNVKGYSESGPERIIMGGTGEKGDGIIKNEEGFTDKSDIHMDIRRREWSGFRVESSIGSFIKRLNRSGLSALDYMSPEKSLHYIMRDLGFDKYLLDRARDGFSREGYISRLNILHSIAAASDTMDNLVENVYGLQKICSEGKRGEGLSLMTCHGSKGLEFEKVYIIDVCEGLFPCCEKNEPEYEEEVRLFYVALTRAMNEAEILTIKNAFYGESQDSEFALLMR